MARKSLLAALTVPVLVLLSSCEDPGMTQYIDEQQIRVENSTQMEMVLAITVKNASWFHVETCATAIASAGMPGGNPPDSTLTTYTMPVPAGYRNGEVLRIIGYPTPTEESNPSVRYHALWLYNLSDTTSFPLGLPNLCMWMRHSQSDTEDWDSRTYTTKTVHTLEITDGLAALMQKDTTVPQRIPEYRGHKDVQYPFHQ